MGTRTSTLSAVVLLCAACAQPEPAPGAAETEGSEQTSTIEGATTVTLERDPELAPEASQPSAPTNPDLVFINGVQLAGPDLAELSAFFGAAPTSGRYWYDATSGLWGLEGHGAGGVTRPNLRTAAPLSPDASAGKSGAFVNGRQLPATELTALATLLSWPLPADSRYAGHYTLDGEGTLNSFKGRYLGNVAAAAKRVSASAGEAPGLILCTWYHLHEPDELFGRDVTIACD